MVFTKRRNSDIGFFGHVSTNKIPYNINNKGNHKGPTDIQKRINRMKHKTCLHIFSNDRENLFLFSDCQIRQAIELRCLSIQSDEIKIDFIKNYPLKKAFLLSDGKQIKAWAEFVNNVYIKDGRYYRKLYIREMKPGYYLEDPIFYDNFSMHFKPKNYDIFKAFLK